MTGQWGNRTGTDGTKRFVQFFGGLWPRYWVAVIDGTGMTPSCTGKGSGRGHFWQAMDVGGWKRRKRPIRTKLRDTGAMSRPPMIEHVRGEFLVHVAELVWDRCLRPVARRPIPHEPQCGDVWTRTGVGECVCASRDVTC